MCNAIALQNKNRFSFNNSQKHTLGQLTKCVPVGRLVKVPTGSVPFICLP